MQIKQEVVIKASQSQITAFLSNPDYFARLFSLHSNFTNDSLFFIKGSQWCYQSNTFLLSAEIRRTLQPITPNLSQVTDYLLLSRFFSHIDLVTAHRMKKLKALSHYQLELLKQDSEYFTQHPFTPCSVLISGASGCIGSALKQLLLALGARVYVLVRHTPHSPFEIQWNPLTGSIPLQQIEGIDAFINLSGAPLAEKRWTKSRKDLLLKSRIEPTQTLAKAIAMLNKPPRVLISMSGAGIYPHSYESINESGSHGTSFLSQLAEHWEEAAFAAQSQTRVVCLRSGAVLTRLGGALPKLTRAVRLGFAGKAGSGQQLFPWISLDDLLKLILYCIEQKKIEGALNAVVPEISTQTTLMHTIGKTIHRPSCIPLPAVLAKIIFGEMADELILHGQNPSACKAEQHGFIYSNPNLKSFLQTELF